MKYQILFSGKHQKTISVCCLLKLLHRVLSVKVYIDVYYMNLGIIKLFYGEGLLSSVMYFTPLT